MANFYHLEASSTKKNLILTAKLLKRRTLIEKCLKFCSMEIFRDIYYKLLLLVDDVVFSSTSRSTDQASSLYKHGGLLCEGCQHGEDSLHCTHHYRLSSLLLRHCRSCCGLFLYRLHSLWDLDRHLGE